MTALHLSVTFDGVVFTSVRSELSHGYRAMPRWTAFVCPLIGAALMGVAPMGRAKEPST